MMNGVDLTEVARAMVAADSERDADGERIFVHTLRLLAHLVDAVDLDHFSSQLEASVEHRS